MPSIPQSLLWIALVVLWLFVLVPMLINKRDTVRRTSDVALSTRVLNSAAASRLLRRRGPAAGHRHDPDWRPEDTDLDEDADYEAEDYDEAVRAAVREAAESRGTSMMSVASLSDATTEPVYIDVDVVEENSGALPVGDGVQETLFEESAGPTAEAAEDGAAEDHAADDAGDAGVYASDEYEYVEDTSGLEADDVEGAGPPVAPPRSNRRRRLESTAAAAVSARKYRFRKRMLTAMAAIMVVTAVLSFTVSTGLWWACGAAGAVTMLYLAYLRRQTRIEEQIRRRRQQRTARMRGEESHQGWASDRGFDVAASRLHRPGAVVLDIDDEDPMFEYLDEVAYSRRYDLPRAAGQ